MKASKRTAIAVAIAAVFAFSTTVCFGQSSGGKTINSAEELKAYLDSQPGNSPDKPIRVTMSANDRMLKEIAKAIYSSGKYVSLTLSGNALTSIPEWAFFDREAEKACETLVSVTIPNSVLSIGENAFLGCGLVSIIIPNSVSSIGDWAFNYCSELTSVTIGNNVTSIGIGAFAYCPLTSITIPNGKIGDAVFINCHSLASVTIGRGVTSIGRQVFSDCISLVSVTFQGTIPSENLREDEYGIRSVGDLWTKYLAGGIGTYTRPNGSSSTWTKQ